MNTNPLAKRILCFGDSNTWGCIPDTKYERFPSNMRWTGILQNLLGNGYEIIEEGLNSRGIKKGDDRSGKEGRAAVEYILPCLDAHDPLDYVIVLLGTNELKAEFNLSANDIGNNLKYLVGMISSRPSQFRDSRPKIVIVVPPSINDQTEYCLDKDKYKGYHDRSVEFKSVFKIVAEETGSLFLDIQDDLNLGDDGIHLSPGSHALLARSLADLLR